MMLSFSSALYALVSVASLWLAVLWISSRTKRSRQLGIAAKVMVGVTATLLLLVPIGSVPLWIRAFSFYPNPSVPMLGIVLAGLSYQLFGVRVFKRGDWDAIWMFGTICGSVLYLHPMLIGSVDLYFWGWDRAVSAWGLGLVAIVFLACGNRLGILLLGALLACRMTALESLNCWDYVMDPAYWLISNSVLLVRGILGRMRRTNGSHGATAPVAPLSKANGASTVII